MKNSVEGSGFRSDEMAEVLILRTIALRKLAMVLLPRPVPAHNPRSRLSDKTNTTSEGMSLIRSQCVNCLPSTITQSDARLQCRWPYGRGRGRPGIRSLPAYPTVGARATLRPRLRGVSSYIEGGNSHASTTTLDAVTARIEHPAAASDQGSRQE